jgi:FAD/FMN-containing dehydrogenase
VDAVNPSVRKNSSGYDSGADLLDLLVGSEGTLAIFTGVEIALTDQPGATSSILAAFPSLEHAAAGATIAREHGAAACELLDRTFVDIAREGGSQAAAGIPPAIEAVLLIEIEAPDAIAARREATELAARLDDAGAALTSLALTADDEHHLWALRHAASPILAQLDPALKSMQFIEDGAVPPDRLADYVRGVRAALERAGLRGVIFGHAGDAHVHVNPLIDVRLPDWRARMESLFEEVCALTIALGGTMSGEHGDGRLRAPVVGAVLGDAAARWARLVKDAFDPRGILNPGAKVPLAGQRPLEQVKYDPALPPLPPRAARALDMVAANRAYAAFRLDLLEGADHTAPRSIARSDPAD